MSLIHPKPSPRIVKVVTTTRRACAIRLTAAALVGAGVASAIGYAMHEPVTVANAAERHAVKSETISASCTAWAVQPVNVQQDVAEAALVIRRHTRGTLSVERWELGGDPAIERVRAAIDGQCALAGPGVPIAHILAEALDAVE